MFRISSPARVYRPAFARRGFYLIGMLIALTIVLILVGTGYFTKNPLTQVTQAQSYIDRSKDTACLADRQTLKADLTSLSLNSGGTLPGIHILRNKLGHRACPGGGEFLIGGQGEVFCTEHAPPAEGNGAQSLKRQ